MTVEDNEVTKYFFPRESRVLTNEKTFPRFYPADVQQRDTSLCTSHRGRLDSIKLRAIYREDR